jgi:D-alanyl-D-alanine carboxypeptidase
MTPSHWPRVLTGALLPCALLFIVGADAGAQSPPEDESTSRAIDQVMSAVYRPNEPGAAVVVVKAGRVVFRKAYGQANVELGVPLQPDSVMPIASLSKAFTAAGILLLAEQGKLSVQDDISRFLPAFRTRGARVTVEHLLTHTSGISSLTETSDLRAAASQEGKVADVVGDWVKDLPPDAAPGERWAYSNWGYNLLAAVIEQVSGTSYPEFVQRFVLGPLGMTRTYYEDRRRVIPLRASGYDVQPDTVLNVLPSRGRSYQPGGSGSWLSTVDDMVRWSEALDGALLLSRESLNRMFTPYHLKDGSSTRYGYGWDLGEYEGRRVQEHQGGVPGFLSHIVRMPDDRVLVVVLSNRYSMAVPLQATAHRVAAIAVGRPIEAPQPVTVPKATLEGLAGSYRGGDVGTCVVAMDGDGLAAEVPGLGKLPLIPVAPGEFRTPVLTWAFSFEIDGTGRAVRMRVRDWKLDDGAERVEPAPPVARPVIAAASSDLDACAGEYESLNGILVKVEHVGDHLAVRTFAQPAVDVFPFGALDFAAKEGGVEYRFVKSDAGQVTGYLRSAGGKPVPARRIR